MKKVYVLYNPLSSKGEGKTLAEKLSKMLGDKIEYIDITLPADYKEFFSRLEKGDSVIVSGGDGTLNRFANSIADIEVKNPLYYYATGSGNDFFKDSGNKNGLEPLRINECVENIPVMNIGGKEYRFINGVGGGLDAYSCVEGNKRHATGKSGNYVLNAIKGILYDYKPTAVALTVDGKKYEFKNVWFASVMKGRFFGGGIMLAPNQDRTGKKLSAVVVHSIGRLRLLTVIPGAFKGKHVKYTKYVTVIEGNNISVEFDRFVAVQYDGETLAEVKAYDVQAGATENVTKALIS